MLTPDGPLSGDWLDQRAGQLLKYLTCERHRVVPADEIAESFCSHAERSTLSTVRYFIHALRNKLEPERPKRGRACVVLGRRGGYTLNDAVVWIDADEFEVQADAGVAALARGERAAATDHLEQATPLYRGDFLDDEPYTDWAMLERERLRALAEKPLRALSELRADEPEVAAGYLERLARMEPFDGGVEATPPRSGCGRDGSAGRCATIRLSSSGCSENWRWPGVQPLEIVLSSGRREVPQELRVADQLPHPKTGSHRVVVPLVPPV